MLEDSISELKLATVTITNTGTEMRHLRTCIKSHSLHGRGKSDPSQRNPQSSSIKHRRQIAHKFNSQPRVMGKVSHFTSYHISRRNGH